MPHIADTDHDSEQLCSGDVSYSCSPGADFGHPDSAHCHSEAALAPSGSSISCWAPHPYHCNAPLRRPLQMHQLHRTLPLLDHLFTFVFTYYINNSIFWCLIFWDWMYYWWCIIYRHHFCLNLAYLYFLYSPTLMFSLKACGFSYMTQTPCHSGGTTSSLFFNRFCHIEDNVQLGWGESWGREFLLLMLSYFGNLVVFCLIFKIFKVFFYSPWLLRKNFQNENGEIEFLSFYLT